MSYKVFPVKFSEHSCTRHYLFYKAHQVRVVNDDKPADRTLFVINVPSFIDENCLKRLFGEFGRVERVFLHKQPSPDTPTIDCSPFYPTVAPIQGYRVAYCVFSKCGGLQRALAAASSTNEAGVAARVASTSQHPLITGLMRWQMEQNEAVLDEAALKADTDRYMAEYDARIEQNERESRTASANGDQQPDADGWIVVRRRRAGAGGCGKRAAPLTDHVQTTAKQRLAAKQQRRQRQRTQLINMYNFQLKDTKKQQLAQLRQKFEEDRRRIAQMRTQRKFRPY